MGLTEAELKAQADAAAKAEADKKAAEGQGAGEDGQDNDNGGEVKIPLRKFQKVNDQVKELSAKLAKYEQDQSSIQQKKLEEEGKLKELIEAKNGEIVKLNEMIAQLKDGLRKTKINSIIRDEVIKYNPRDINDVFPLIDMNSLTIDEDGDNVVIHGIKEFLEKLKKQKDYLFAQGTSSKNDNVKGDENGKPASGSLESIEAEYRLLLQKGTLTSGEQKKLNSLAAELKKLKAAKK